MRHSAPTDLTKYVLSHSNPKDVYADFFHTLPSTS